MRLIKTFYFQAFVSHFLHLRLRDVVRRVYMEANNVVGFTASSWNRNRVCILDVEIERVYTRAEIDGQNANENNSNDLIRIVPIVLTQLYDF